MTATIAFDTHKYVKRLTAAGMPEPQAEVIADEQRSLIEEQLATRHDIKESEAATRQDIKASEAATRHAIKELETTTQRDIKELEAATRRDLKELEQRMTIRLGIMMAASVALLSAMMAIL